MITEQTHQVKQTNETIYVTNYITAIQIGRLTTGQGDAVYYPS